jgi:single-strand DNA-binding protein
MGRLAANPDFSVTAAGKRMCKFALAVDRPKSKETVDFFDLIAWEDTADFMCKHFKKGQRAAVVGYLTARKWTDKDGGNRKAVEIVAIRAYFAGGGATPEAMGACDAKPAPEWESCGISDDELFEL